VASDRLRVEDVEIGGKKTLKGDDHVLPCKHRTLEREVAADMVVGGGEARGGGRHVSQKYTRLNESKGGDFSSSPYQL
jgi:hypothetical protein